MTPAELRHRLAASIPLSQAMAVDVVHADTTRVVLSAPLAQNHNHLGTVFGGSANALAILAAWSLLQLKLDAHQPPCQIIIQRNSMDYLHPISAAMTAECQFNNDMLWSRFLRTLARHHRARLTLHAEVLSAGRVCAGFDGDFVAISTSRNER